jgi:protein translocase SecG subunit
MTLLEKVWILISILIIFIILSTDPKNSINGSWGNQLSTVFASASDGQKFIKQVNWVLITAFFLITLSLSYLA